ncbi:S-adenosyl-L-methionine-dependent methyltransferase [Hypoxylon sp. EC38]|nr:S-adenosyl-L-methionine-dependent methyltransferase [Hypoxylon sp. EC38]
MDSQLDNTSRRLLELGGLIQKSIASYVCSRHTSNGPKEGTLPSKPLFEAQRNLLAAAGMLTELVSEPQARLLEVSTQYFEARCLHIITDKRIPDLLSKKGKVGLHIQELASVVEIEPKKLSRIMRCLCSIHIFSEIEEDVFANNPISASLVDNEPLRAYILLFALDLYTCSDYLPRYLTDPSKGASYSAEITPWQDAIGTTKHRWDWLDEKVKVGDIRSGRNGSPGRKSAYPGVFGTTLEKTCGDADDRTLIHRPEHAIFGLAMVGGGRVSGQAHLYESDYPWASLGSATIVDVGGGVGGFALQLLRLYPELRVVIQDRAPVLEQAQRDVWPKENPAAVQSGRVKFTPLDFFQLNPIKHADVYWLRYVLHDWPDDDCVKILGAIKPAMGPRSRVLLCDQVMNTTAGCDELRRAPEPLPANWGYFTRYAHQRDLAMMSVINGIERTPAQLRNIVERAGLCVRKFWECRSQVGLAEVVLVDSELLIHP